VSLLSSNDWKERLQGLDLFVELAERNPQGLGGKFTKVHTEAVMTLIHGLPVVKMWSGEWE